MMSSSPLDDFLAGNDTANGSADLLQGVGVGASIVGIVLATGLVVFLATVHRGEQAERYRLLRFTCWLGVVTAVGAAIEVAGTARLLGVGYAETLTDGDGAAAMLRLLAGMLIALGLYDLESPDDRWRPTSASAFGLTGIVVGVASFSFDGHTVTNGPRGLHLLVNMVHVFAGGVWAGGVVALVVVGFVRRRSERSIGPLVVRFSFVATIALAMVATAGIVMSLIIVDGWGDYTGTPWGQRLLIKVAVVAGAVGIGAYNHFVVVRRLEQAGDEGPSAQSERTVARTLRIEAVLLVGATIVTALLVRASTV